MTDIDEKNAWKRYKEQGDADARDKLILQHMRTVKYIAGRMAMHVPNNVEMDDLVGWGVLGLMDAVEKFDHKQVVKFVTYASIRIRGAIIDEIRSLDWAPRSLRTMGRKVGAARDKLRHRSGKEPSAPEIAEEIGSSPEQVEQALAQLQSVRVLSLDEYLPSEDSSEVSKHDITSNASLPSPSHVAEMKERQELLVKAILALPEQQQKVLNLYYYEDLTLKEVGVVLEVSESRVSQIHSAAMKKLRRVVRAAE